MGADFLCTLPSLLSKDIIATASHHVIRVSFINLVVSSLTQLLIGHRIKKIYIAICIIVAMEAVTKFSWEIISMMDQRVGHTWSHKEPASSTFCMMKTP